MMERRPDFADTTRLIEGSLLGRSLTAGVRYTEAAAASSTTAALLKSLRITHFGVIITSFCATDILLLQLIPERLAPVKPLAYGMVLAFTALVIAVGRMTTRSSATATADNSAGTANAINS